MRRAPATIVILTWNGWAATRACLDSLRPTLRTHDQVVVVDNGSQDGTPRRLARYPWIEVVANEENRGFAAGCNQGAALARHELVVFLNNDTLLVGRWLDALLEPFSDLSVGAAGSRSNFVSGEQLVEPVGYRTRKLADIRQFERDWRQRHGTTTSDVERLVGFCLAVRRSAFDAVGGFDESFGLGGFEDDDLCTRLAADGQRLVIAHGSFVHHDGHKTFEANGVDWLALQQENAVRYRDKHGGATGLSVGGQRPLLSACLIVRDEEARLATCLASIAGVVDEVVVYDTGSKDETVEIARAAGATVVEGCWDDDFARARNAALEACTGTWVLHIDADEELRVDGDLRSELDEARADALSLIIDNVGAHGQITFQHPGVRLFRRDRGCWTGRLHEQVVAQAGQRPLRHVESLTAGLLHWGYGLDPTRTREKQERNLRIARAAVGEGGHVERGGQVEGTALVNLALALCGAGRSEEGLARFDDALSTQLDGVQRRRALREGVGTLIDAGRPAEALEWLQQLRTEAVDSSAVTYLEALALANLGDRRQALELLRPLESVRDGDGYLLPEKDLHLRRGMLAFDEERWAEAFDALMGVAILDARAAPWAPLAVACLRAEAGVGRVADVIPRQDLVTVLGQLLTAPADVADPVVEVLWDRFPGEPSLLACAARLAPALTVERALEWSSRLRAAGLTSECPLLALARDTTRSVVERLQAAAVVAAGFDAAGGEGTLLDIAPDVAEETFTTALVTVSEIAPTVLPQLVAALATTPSRCLAVGRSLCGLGASEEGATMFLVGLELSGAVLPDLPALDAERLERDLAARSARHSPAVPVDTGRDAPLSRDDDGILVARQLEVNAADLERLESHVERLVDRGDDEQAARWAQVAGHAAWSSHPGRFSSHRIERALATVADRHARPVGRSGSPDRDEGRVLHVLTEAHALGGHTRLAWRWMRGDASHRHELVLSQHGDRPVPDELVEACEGRVHLIGRGRRSLLERAQSLRELAAGVGAVVLHTHPFDVVPLLALQPRPAPVLLVNHAGHVFWLGASVGDVVVNLRESTRALAATRRGVEPHRLALLPSPLDPVGPKTDGRAARLALGIDPDAKMLLTIASPYKYAATGTASLLDLVMPVLERNPDVVLVAVGPHHEGEWAAAAHRVGGRVRAFGHRSDLRPFHDAADVYLDSYPLPSTTSLLEAAAVGTPVVSFAPGGHAAGPLAVDDLALGELLQVAETARRYEGIVEGLLADGRRRAELGAASARTIAAEHTGTGWQAWLARVHDQLRAVDAASPAAADIDGAAIPELDEALLSLHLHGGQSVPIEQLLQLHGAVVDGEVWR